MSGIIVAVVNEVWRTNTGRTAMELAKNRDSRLILYDIDAPAMWTSPTPPIDPERYQDPLTASHLYHLGRPELAKHVEDARERGIEAFGWLPSSAKPQALVDYATEIGAATIVMPRVLTGQSWYQRFQGLTSAHIQDATSNLEFVLVGGETDKSSD